MQKAKKIIWSGAFFFHQQKLDGKPSFDSFALVLPMMKKGGN